MNEIRIAIEATEDKRKRDMRDSASLLYGVTIVGILGHPMCNNKIPSIEETFPSLFDKEINEDLEEKLNVARAKEYFTNFALAHNKDNKERNN